MLWLYLTIITIAIWSALNIWDKYIASKELRDPILLAVVVGATISIFYLVIGGIVGGIDIPVRSIVSAMIAGFVYPLGLWFYYYVMEREEVSRFVPILAMEPLVISFFAFLFLGERMEFVSYLGIALIVVGAISISYKKYNAKVKSQHLFVIAGLAVLAFSARNLFFKEATDFAPFWPTIFWFGVGGIFVPVILFIFHHPHVIAKGRTGIKHAIFCAILSGIALICFVKAVSLGSVTIVSGFSAAKPLVVFFAATLLSFFHPKILREKHSRGVLAVKFIGTVLIVVGSILTLF